ncbi:nitrate reductase molybdenum cofactor assembly chaperone [Saccharothrix mutabilis subsp. mutabilis]|uniref:Nitrate reductase molybdenum cofactor assembly chaperone n=1 Tax=Saccharothrix mutabilis subsp. mutabilis TaxID=66855 RepID=A0ABN0UHF0_9PSEU
MTGRAETFRLLGLLLQYPDGGPPVVPATVPDGPAREPLTRFLAWYGAQSPFDLAQHYVETFDLRRRTSLYLTYYLHGDTRRRGMAMLMLKQRYRAAGLTPPEDELPDYLPVVCEFAALLGPGAGEAPLRQHRTGLELIRAGLHDAGSPYAALLDALTALLGELTPEDQAAVRELAASGPPDEEVGLAPFAPPEYLTGREVRA